MNAKKAFTKTDLLFTLGCTIFLLINLGAIGGSGREMAKEAVCLSNLQKWGQCFSLYTGDNSGYFDTGGSGVNEKWANSLRPYYRQDNLRLCPTATMFWWENEGEWGVPFDNPLDSPFAAWGKYRKEEFPHSWSKTGIYGSYGSNSWIYNKDATADIENNFWKTINVIGGDNIPMLADCTWIGGRPDTTNTLPEFNGAWTQYGTVLGNNLSRFMMDRHSGGIQGVFMDLSARKIGVKGVGRLKWHREYDENYFGPTFMYWPDWIKPYPYE